MAWVGANIEIIAAIVVYMVSFVLVTEMLKGWSEQNGVRALILSWLVGILIFLLLAIWGLFEFSFPCVLLFMLITGATNLTYKFTALKKFVRWIFELVPIRG
jgi:uncharacterized membrane protein YoaK (UPF0700 family)